MTNEAKGGTPANSKDVYFLRIDDERSVAQVVRLRIGDTDPQGFTLLRTSAPAIKTVMRAIMDLKGYNDAPDDMKESWLTKNSGPIRSAIQNAPAFSLTEIDLTVVPSKQKGKGKAKNGDTAPVHEPVPVDEEETEEEAREVEYETRTAQSY